MPFSQAFGSNSSRFPLPPLLTPAAALSWSEASIDAAVCRGPCIGVWRPRGGSVAVGIGQDVAEEADIEAMRRDGVGLIRRPSGGGAVLLYEGVLCWEAWAGLEEIQARQAEGSGIRQAYRVLCGPVIEGLSGFGLSVFQTGVCDISHAVSGALPKKIAGTAQLRRKDMVLVHGSLLVYPELGLLSKYLRQPKSQPEYRENRTHGDFCITVASLLGCREGSSSLLFEVADRICEAAHGDGWLALEAGSAVGGVENDLTRARELECGKYCSHDWNWEKKRPLF